MFLLYEANKFPFSLQKLDEQGNPHSILFWTSLERKNSKEYNFKDYIDYFIHPTTFLLSSNAEPRVIDEIQNI